MKRINPTAHGPSRKRALSTAPIYEKMTRRGEFPRQVPLGTKAVGWVESEIDEWIDRCTARRDGIKEPKAA